MALGIVLFGLMFLGGLGLGVVTHRPVATASLVVGAFIALVVSKSGNGFAAFAAFALIALAGAVASSVRETVELLLGGSPRSTRRLRPPRPAAERRTARRERPRVAYPERALEPSLLPEVTDWLPSSDDVGRDTAGRPGEGSIAA